MTEMLPVLPVIIPLLTAILNMFAWGNIRLQRRISVVGLSLLFLVGSALLHTVNTEGIQVVFIGNWQAPYGIVLVADLFSAVMVFITGMMGILIMLYAIRSMSERRQPFAFYPLYNTLIMGVCGAFLTGDLFNLYVWFEVLLMSSFVLLSLGGEKRQLVGAIQYVTINLISSTLFLLAVGMMYSVVGTLNMADLAQRLPLVDNQHIVDTLTVMLLIAFGIKAAVFPLFFWLPVSYDVPPTTISALFAALLTKVGVYSMVRTTMLLFPESDFVFPVLAIIAGFTMVLGVMGAASEYDFRRVLSFHIISQIGYMVMGLAIATPLALAGTIYFVLHNIIAKTNLFLISGIVNEQYGNYYLKKLGGIYRAQPVFAVVFLTSALALAGIPPLSGFWGKYSLIRAGLEAEDYAIIGVSLFVSVWTLYSMMKIWAEAFLKNPPEDVVVDSPLWTSDNALMLTPIVILAGCSVLMGVAAEPIFELLLQAGEQLSDPQIYIQAVFQTGG